MTQEWKTIANEKEKYSAYLCSREWAEKREAVRKRACNKCERCMVLPMNACHHRTYERKYYEKLEDLQAICTSCHEFTHGKDGFDPCENVYWLRYVISTKDNDDRPAVDPTAAFFGHTHIMEQTKLFAIARQFELTLSLSQSSGDNEIAGACEIVIDAIDNCFSRTAILWMKHGMPRMKNVTYAHMLDVIGISDRDDPKSWER